MYQALFCVELYDTVSVLEPHDTHWWEMNLKVEPVEICSRSAAFPKGH